MPQRICRLCGQPATLRVEADVPMGLDFPPMYYEQRDGLVLLTTYSCTEHVRGVAADLPHPTIRPL